MNCPNNTYILEDNENFICQDNTPNGYYLDEENEIYRKCFETCSKCEKGGNKTNNNCLKCKDNFMFYNNSLNIQNCYEICEYYYYFDESNEYHCDVTCPDKYKKIINEKKKCTDDCKNDDFYKYEYNNICYHECPDDTIMDEAEYICYDKKFIETTIIIDNSNITKDERDEEMENFRGKVSDFNISENKDILSKKDNVQYQMTTSDNQKNNTNKNTSSIDLGDCEDKLKEIYGIDKSLPLIIFKIDYFSPDSLIYYKILKY